MLLYKRLKTAARIPAERLHDHPVIVKLPEFRKVTARVMHKLRVALQMSCTRAVGGKSFEAIWRDEHCLRRASQRSASVALQLHGSAAGMHKRPSITQ